MYNKKIENSFYIDFSTVMITKVIREEKKLNQILF